MSWAVTNRFRWLLRKRGEIRRELAQRIQIKHAPDWVFLMDQAFSRGNRILDVLDEIDRQDREKAQEDNT